MFERIFAGASAGSVLGLQAMILVAVLLGPRLELLLTFNGPGASIFLGAWLAFALALCTVRDVRRAWRIACVFSAALALASAVATWFIAAQSTHADSVEPSLTWGVAATFVGYGLLMLQLARAGRRVQRGPQR